MAKWNTRTLKLSIISRFHRDSRAWTCVRVSLEVPAASVAVNMSFVVHCVATFRNTTYVGGCRGNLKMQPKADLSAAVQHLSRGTSCVLKSLANSDSKISQRSHCSTNLPTRVESSLTWMYFSRNSSTYRVCRSSHEVTQTSNTIRRHTLTAPP